MIDRMFESAIGFAILLILALEERRREERADYHTLGGLVVTELGRIPQSGDAFEAHDLRFEVMDMDGHRVD